MYRAQRRQASARLASSARRSAAGRAGSVSGLVSSRPASRVELRPFGGSPASAFDGGGGGAEAARAASAALASR
ncbi:MAG TPA: hypothetical protein PK280_00465 [Planctomycetota bacterium]|nr:hypothetical protein [Planctomycetota bacterium]